MHYRNAHNTNQQQQPNKLINRQANDKNCTLQFPQRDEIIQKGGG